jgi:uncharacterized Zn finger protein
MSYWGFRPYVPVAQRRAQALREIEKLRRKGGVVKPIAIEGRKIAKTFWGKAWCDNLERYSDFANRLPRGRTYVCNGSVIDLQIAQGKVEALVSGSEIYKVKIDIAIAAPSRWKAICADCAGSVGSLIELMQGKLSKNVMERVCREAEGLFPTPKEIKMSCSCPDWADMCKHVAATFYGVGARLDSDPDVLFSLRGVDRGEIVSTVGADFPLTRIAATSERILADEDVAALFGLDMEALVAPTPKAERGAPTKARRGSRNAAAEASRAGDEKSDRMKETLTSRSSKPSPSPAAKRQAKPTRRPKATSTPAAAATTKRGGARTKPAAVSPSPFLGTKAAEPRRPGPRTAGRTRAAKWIGARARKVDR